MPPPSVLVVIVNYRTPGLAVDCLASLEPLVRSHGRCRAVVVDGGSGDDSAGRLQAAIADNGWQPWCELLVLKENRGFAAGNNAALRPALGSASPPDYVWLLNPDTVVRPGALEPLTAYLAAHPRVGIVGSRLEDPDGTPQRSAFRFPGILSEFDHGARLGVVTRLLARQVVAPPARDEAHSTDWVSGASFLVRRGVFEAIGLLDERFFLYYEETEFCFRATKAGWLCAYVPSSRVVHLVGQSSGMSPSGQHNRRIPSYWFESRRRYFDSSHGRLYTHLADMAQLVGHLSWWVRAKLQRKPLNSPHGYLGDFCRHNAPWRRGGGTHDDRR